MEILMQGESDLLKGLAMVAVGTSLPEVPIAGTAAMKGNTGLVIGDLIGSNVTNIIFILACVYWETNTKRAG